MPIWMKSDEGVVNQIVTAIQDCIRTYGLITVMDVYDIIEGYEPMVKADRHFSDIYYVWTCVDDFYGLYAYGGVTIGIRNEPMLRK
jgi:hypothetical protein